jgi:glutamate-ammonia-ligase adenylyltransferase
MLVTSYAAFDRYHQEEAAPWERVALLRARPVYTSAPHPDDPVSDFAPLLEQIAYHRPVAQDVLRRDLLRMRDRIAKERAGDGGGAVHLRFSAGGLTDLEFVAAWHQLQSGARDPGLRTSSPFEAVARLAARGDVAPTLPEDYRALQRASLRLRLLRDRPDDRLLPEDRPALARSFGIAEADLAADLDARRARVRAVFLSTLGS